MGEPEEASAELRVVNDSGLHARPCHAVVALALRHDAELRFRHGSRDVNGKSILELMTLNAPQDSRLEALARGPDAAVLIERLGVLFASGFEESS